jgi:dihydroflavonol-4-reductase
MFSEVLITGASGCIGGAVARRLRQAGVPVRALVRPSSDVAVLEAIGARLVTGDVRDAAAVDAAAAGVERIFHFAGLLGTARLPDRDYVDVHVGGTANVLAAAAKHGVGRVVHGSTIGVHGSVREIPCHEDTPFNPGDHYQRTKLEGERLAQEAAKRGQPVTIVRPASVYGPGDRRLLKLFRLLRKGRFVMFGSGRSRWHPIYIDDLVDGLLLAAGRPQALGRTYILAGPRDVSLAEWIEEVARATGGRAPRLRLPYPMLYGASVLCEAVCRPLGIEPPLHRRRASFFVNERAFTTRRAAAELGFRPTVDIPEGVRRTAAWYRELGLLD